MGDVVADVKNSDAPALPASARAARASAPLAAAFAAVGPAGHARATTITVTEELHNGNESVSINTGAYEGIVNGVHAGQQQLTVTTSSSPSLVGQTLDAWCVDWGEDIVIGSSDNVFSVSQFTTPPTLLQSVPPVTLTSAKLAEEDERSGVIGARRLKPECRYFLHVVVSEIRSSINHYDI